MCSYSSHNFRRASLHSLFYFHFNTIRPICKKVLYHPFFIDVQGITLGSTMYTKAYLLNQCNTAKLTNSEK